MSFDHVKNKTAQQIISETLPLRFDGPRPHDQQKEQLRMEN